MHPDICRFPSLHFYDSKLLNGEQTSAKTASFHATEGLGPYVFFDIVDGKELRSKNSGVFSLYNEHEASAAVELLRFFKKRYMHNFSPENLFKIFTFLYTFYGCSSTRFILLFCYAYFIQISI